MCIPLLAACALLASCGQRGALYLPEEDRNVVVTPAPAPAASPAAPPAASPAATPAEDSDTDTQRRNSTPPAR